MIQLGNGHLYNTDAIALMQSLPAECVDLIATDPPYRVISGGQGADRDNGYFNSVLSGVQNGKIFQHNDVSIESFMREFYRLLKPGCHCYVMINNMNLRELLNVAAKVGFEMHNLLGWQKNNANANRWYMKHIEWCVLFYKKPAKTINNPGSKQLFAFDNPRNKSHKTEKPVELMQHWIENSTQPGELVLDPFVGSGATAIAAERSGRRWIACELDVVYYTSAIVRIMAG